MPLTSIHNPRARLTKTKPSEPTTAVKKFLNAIEHPVRKADALRLDKIMREETGFKLSLIHI